MTIKNSIRVIFALLLVAFTTACDWDSSDSNSFAYDIRGTWRSNDASLYAGELLIEYNKITIYGYEETQTFPSGDDTKRPFRDFTKGTPLSGYTENGIMFIRDAGMWNEIPYIYYAENYGNDRFLRFNFGGRIETLRRIK